MRSPDVWQIKRVKPQKISRRCPGGNPPGISVVKREELLVSDMERKPNQTEDMEYVVLCGSNSYEKNYYFNQQFQNLPQDIKDQLRIMCVWFTEEIGGILTLEFTPEGKLEFRHRTLEYDGFYDEIGADLKVKQLIREGQELLEALELYYQVFFLGKTEKVCSISAEEKDGEV